MSTDHSHADFEMPGGFVDPHGRPVDHKLLGQFVGAAFDGCVSCQDTHLTLMAEDSATAARLVELACMTAQELFGGLPAGMTNEGAPGGTASEFRRLARIGLDGANDAMFAACEQMTSVERRAAANAAADLLVGYLTVP